MREGKKKSSEKSTSVDNGCGDTCLATSPPQSTEDGRLNEHALQHLDSCDRDQLGRLVDAMAAIHGANQARIARVALGITVTLLKKNADYGSSVFKTPRLAPETDPGTAIRVRMADKVERLERLLGGEPAEVKESINDTMLDLAGYAILYLARP